MFRLFFVHWRDGFLDESEFTLFNFICIWRFLITTTSFGILGGLTGSLPQVIPIYFHSAIFCPFQPMSSSVSTSALLFLIPISSSVSTSAALFLILSFPGILETSRIYTAIIRAAFVTGSSASAFRKILMLLCWSLRILWVSLTYYLLRWTIHHKLSFPLVGCICPHIWICSTS